MQFRPCARFCQYSSRFFACGNCPAIPITAIADNDDFLPDTTGAATVEAAAWLPKRAARRRRRRELSFSVANFDVANCPAFGVDNATLALNPTGAASGRLSVPRFSAS